LFYRGGRPHGKALRRSGEGQGEEEDPGDLPARSGPTLSDSPRDRSGPDGQLHRPRVSDRGWADRAGRVRRPTSSCDDGTPVTERVRPPTSLQPNGAAPWALCSALLVADQRALDVDVLVDVFQLGRLSRPNCQRSPEFLGCDRRHSPGRAARFVVPPCARRGSGWFSTRWLIQIGPAGPDQPLLFSPGLTRSAPAAALRPRRCRHKPDERRSSVSRSSAANRRAAEPSRADRMAAGLPLAAGGVVSDSRRTRSGDGGMSGTPREGRSEG
jgi:hypothetical protein